MIVYTSSTATGQGWDAVDRRLLGVMRHGALTMDGITANAADLPGVIVQDAVHGYVACGFARRTGLGALSFELTLAGYARLAALSAITRVQRLAETAKAA